MQAADGEGEEEMVSGTLPGLMDYGKWGERQVHEGLSECSLNRNV